MSTKHIYSNKNNYFVYQQTNFVYKQTNVAATNTYLWQQTNVYDNKHMFKSTPKNNVYGKKYMLYTSKLILYTSNAS